MRLKHFGVSRNTLVSHDRPSQSEKPTHVNLRLIRGLVL